MLSSEQILEKLEENRSLGQCLKRKVGCVIVLESGVLVEGFNGMPDGSGLSCLDGDCPRCLTSTKFPHGLGYDLCFCLHAEEKAIANAACLGIPLQGSMLFSTYQPCIMCLKKIVQAGIVGIRFIEPWQVPSTSWGEQNLQLTYLRLCEALPRGVSRI